MRSTLPTRTRTPPSRSASSSHGTRGWTWHRVDVPPCAALASFAMLHLNLNALQRSGALGLRAACPAEDFTLGGPAPRLPQPVQVNLEARYTASGQVMVKGRMSTTLAQVCRRCLQPVEQAFALPVRFLFVPADEADCYEDDGEVRIFPRIWLNSTSAVRCVKSSPFRCRCTSSAVPTAGGCARRAAPTRTKPAATAPHGISMPGGRSCGHSRITRANHHGRTQTTHIKAAAAQAPHASSSRARCRVELPSRCDDPQVPHRVCPTCGYYRDRQVIEVEFD